MTDLHGEAKMTGALDLRTLSAQWLEEHGYDGLWSDFDCGCFLFDLMPCDQPSPRCQPGYAQVVDGPDDFSEGVGPDKKHHLEEGETLVDLVATLAATARGEGAGAIYNPEKVARRRKP